MEVLVGGCACGAAKVRAEGLSREMSACWCEPCRRWQGLCGMGLSVPAAGFSAEGPVRVWRSSPIAERAFCGACGGALGFFDAGVVEPTPGLFANAAGAALDHENFVERRPEGVRFAGGHRQLTAADYAARAQVVDLGEPPAPDRFAGGCACGAVRFRAAAAEEHCGACHCRTCQRWSGGPFVAVTVRGADLSVEGAEHLLRWRSSERAERVSCAICGSKLWFHVMSVGGDRTGGDADDHEICLGAFDDMGGRPLASEIFIDAKPAGYAFAQGHPRTSGEDATTG